MCTTYAGVLQIIQMEVERWRIDLAEIERIVARQSSLFWFDMFLHDGHCSSPAPSLRNSCSSAQRSVPSANEVKPCAAGSSCSSGGPLAVLGGLWCVECIGGSVVDGGGGSWRASIASMRCWRNCICRIERHMSSIELRICCMALFICSVVYLSWDCRI